MSGTRVLVVDDHQDLADGIAMLLQRLPADVQVAYSAKEACARLEERPFHLVVTDIRMPEVDGKQLLDKVVERWPRTKVLMMTAYGSIDSAVDAMKRGACNYVTKPFDNNELLGAVRSALQEQEAVAELELRCLGPFEIYRNGQLLDRGVFSRSKALVLLKTLVVRAGYPLSRDALAEQLWPGVEPKSGANRLRGVVHELRSVIEPHRSERRWVFVCTDGDHYYFDMDSPHRIDLYRYREKLAQAREAEREGRPLSERIECLEEATDLYRGDLFEGDSEEWWDAPRNELRERFIEALKVLAQYHEQQGEHEQAIHCLRRALKSDMLREDLHQALIEMLITVGRRNDAVVQYRECVQLLKQELDAEPLPRLQRVLSRLGIRPT